MNDNGNIRLLTPENDMRVRAFLSSLEELSEKVEKIRENNKPSLDGERSVSYTHLTLPTTPYV